MIGIDEQISGGNSEDDARNFVIFILGALRMKGLPITPVARQGAKAYAEAWVNGADPHRLNAILQALGLCPDDVLPPDDAKLERVIALGREVERGD